MLFTVSLVCIETKRILIFQTTCASLTNAERQPQVARELRCVTPIVVNIMPEEKYEEILKLFREMGLQTNPLCLICLNM
jgi:hypothetical protein